jgi:hypothetical protein
MRDQEAAGHTLCVPHAVSPLASHGVCLADCPCLHLDVTYAALRRAVQTTRGGNEMSAGLCFVHSPGAQVCSVLLCIFSGVCW